MKKTYEEAELEVMYFEQTDVIATSDGFGGDGDF